MTTQAKRFGVRLPSKAFLLACAFAFFAPALEPMPLPDEAVLDVALDLGTNDDKDPILQVPRWYIKSNHQLTKSLVVQFNVLSSAITAGTRVDLEIIDAINGQPQVLDLGSGKPRPPWKFHINAREDWYPIPWSNCRLNPSSGRVFRIRVSIPELNATATTEEFVIQPQR